MEIAVAAVAIVFLVMGFFVLGGIGLTSIKALLETRYYAEKNAENKSVDSPSAVQQIAGWNYTEVVQKRADGDLSITIPFLAHDESLRTSHDLGGGYLSDVNDSLSNYPELASEPEKADYVWQNFDNLVTRQILSFNSSGLAALHRQAPVLPDEVGLEQNYLFRTSSNGGKFQRSLRDGGWGDFQSIDILKWESSVVAFPAFAPQK